MKCLVTKQMETFASFNIQPFQMTFSESPFRRGMKAYV